MPDNNALVLEILRQDNALAMSVFDQGELASTLRHYSKLPLSSPEINNLCQEILTILNKRDKKVHQESDLANNLKKSGQLLWDHLLTKPVKEKLKATQVLDLILSIDEELVNIPWELLYTGDNFLCLKFNLGRVVRTKEQLSLPQYRSLSGHLKMLILANPTADLKSAYSEGVFIKNQFDRKRKEISIDFKSTNIDTLYVKKNLRDYDIVHFAGHCQYDADNPKNTGWILNDRIFTVHDICVMGQTLSLPTLVFSNACHSAKISNDSLDTDCQQRAYSLASAFLFSGVRHYIGTIRKIEDPVSLTFAKEFYSRLISGYSVGECIRFSRLKLVKEHGITAISWASYILYGDPKFALFRARLKPRIPKTKKLYRRTLLGLAFLISVISICGFLYFWLPTVNPNTYVLFLKSRSSFTNGDNEKAILFSKNIIEKEPLFLAAYPLLGDAYQRLGKKDEALKCYFDYAIYSQKRSDKKNLTEAYIRIGWFYHLQGDYPKAFDFYHKALDLSKANKYKLSEALALRKLAVWYIDKNDYDKALELLTKSSEINREGQHIYEHKYNLACDYFDIGLVFTNKNDLVTATEFYNKSRILFEKLRVKNELSDYYFNLGEIYLLEKQYQKALENYMMGLKIDQAQVNKPNLASDYNMIGELYLAMDNLTEAEKFFNQALLISREISANIELAEAYYNLGSLYRKRNQKNKSKEYLRQAQEIYYLTDPSRYQEVKNELLSLSN